MFVTSLAAYSESRVWSSIYLHVLPLDVGSWSEDHHLPDIAGLERVSLTINFSLAKSSVIALPRRDGKRSEISKKRTTCCQ